MEEDGYHHQAEERVQWAAVRFGSLFPPPFGGGENKSFETNANTNRNRITSVVSFNDGQGRVFGGGGGGVVQWKEGFSVRLATVPSKAAIILMVLEAIMKVAAAVAF